MTIQNTKCCWHISIAVIDLCYVLPRCRFKSEGESLWIFEYIRHGSPSRGPPGCIINLPIPSSVVVKNGWSYTYTLPICPSRQERGNFTWWQIGLLVPHTEYYWKVGRAWHRSVITPAWSRDNHARDCYLQRQHIVQHRACFARSRINASRFTNSLVCCSWKLEEAFWSIKKHVACTWNV